MNERESDTRMYKLTVQTVPTGVHSQNDTTAGM